jgi:hypothetical protein
MPVVITNDSGCLPTEMVTLGGGNAAQSDGGDIRFTSDLAGTTQIPCEVVTWVQNATPSLAVAELWIKTDLSSTVDTTVYVWYNAGGGQSQPGAGTSFGSQAVWDTNYQTVLHLKDGTTLSMADSTSHTNTATNHGGCVANPGKIDGGAALTRNSLFLTAPYLSGFDASAVTFSLWFKSSISGQFQTLMRRDDGGSHRNFLFRLDNTDKITIFVIWGGNGGVTSSATYADANWHHAVCVFNAGAIELFIDGASKGTASVSGSQPTTSQDLFIGQYSGSGEGFTGTLDEARYSNTNRSSSWIATEYNNMNAPASFTVAGTPVATGGGVAAITVSMHFMRMRRP